MKKEIGLWIDSHKAVVVILTLKGEVIRRFNRESDPTEIPATGAEDSSADNSNFKIQNRTTEFYQRVVSAVRDGDSIFIFGPGNAKDEFEKQMQRAGLDELIIDVQTDGEMTDRQISAKVNRIYPNNRRLHIQLPETEENKVDIHETT